MDCMELLILHRLIKDIHFNSGGIYSPWVKLAVGNITTQEFQAQFL
jgi:hypothetical protein